MRALLISFLLILSVPALAQIPHELATDDINWHTQSRNSGESMPCGGGDIGLNVWVENGELLFYISRSGTFDENNTFLKLGRVRVKLSPDPLAGKDFLQTLRLEDGSVVIKGNDGRQNANIKLWVDVFRPVIHLEIKTNRPVVTTAAFESWRYRDRNVKGRENNQDSWKWEARNDIITRKDEISFAGNGIEFYHHNLDSTVFDATVRQQGLEGVKHLLFNPIGSLTFGGKMMAPGMEQAGTYEGTYLGTDYKGWRLMSRSAKKSQQIEIVLQTIEHSTVDKWRTNLNFVITEAKTHQQQAWQQTANWWKQYWLRSFIYINPDKPDATNLQWQLGRNYQLFRYMLGCNAFGAYPTKFNGGLFTYDPVLVDSSFKYTPDFRNWGGGLMTAQNQRLVYWPMLKSGDIDLMKPQFDFYLRSLKNAELRSQVYWDHHGASFTEQVENFGLPNRAEYGLKRPADFDKGVEYNAWLEYEWDTALEFCMMMLETERYDNRDISPYLPFIKSCLTFFDEHYQYLARKRGIKPLDADGHLVLYPGSGGETYKMAYNSTSTIAALQTVLSRLLELPEKYLLADERKNWQAMLKRIPPMNFREINGHRTISPALTWQRINNVESMQLYPVFPWGMYGIGKPDIDVALNTWKYDTLAIKFRSGLGWKQDNLFAARLGLTKEAAELTTFKLNDSGRRFPAFWGPGFDWTPDHNQGGSGMIGLQEMLMQTVGEKIYLFAAWPKEWNVHFKLHAPYQTTVEATITNGKITQLSVWPKAREKDIVNMY